VLDCSTGWRHLPTGAVRRTKVPGRCQLPGSQRRGHGPRRRRHSWPIYLAPTPVCRAREGAARGGGREAWV